MMCLACEQDVLWFAYLQRRGLITPDGYLVEQPPSLAAPIKSDTTSAEKNQDNLADPAQKDLFTCGDPSEG